MLVAYIALTGHYTHLNYHIQTNMTSVRAFRNQLVAPKKGDRSYCQYRRLQVQVDWVHDNKDLLVLVCQASSLPECRPAEVLHPAVLAEKRGRKTQWQAQFEGEAVYAG